VMARDAISVGCSSGYRGGAGVFRDTQIGTWTVPVTREYSGRAAVFGEELQNCRRADPAICEGRQRAKIQCQDSASEL
jgi:hypothetical protein